MGDGIIVYKNKILQAKSDVLSYRKKAEDLLNVFKPDNNIGPKKYPEMDKNNIIQKLKSNIVDIARTNIFSFEITQFPTVLNTGNIVEGINEKFNFLISKVSIPGKKIEPTKIKYNGLQKRFPNTYDLDPIEVTFYLDKSYNIYKFFNVWIAEISGRSNSGIVGLNYLDDIKAQARISILDVKKREIYYTDLSELFPIEISKMDYDTTDEKIQTVTVKFSYLESIQPETLDYHKQEIEAKSSGYFKGLSTGVSRNNIQKIVDKINNIGNILNK